LEGPERTNPTTSHLERSEKKICNEKNTQNREKMHLKFALKKKKKSLFFLIMM